MDVPIWERSIPFLLLYFAPVLIGAWRRMQGREKSWPVWGLFLVVFLTGWSVIGWLFALRMAFRDVELPWDAVLNAGGGSYGGGGGGGGGGPVPAERQRCSGCGGTGEGACNACGGRGSWYESATSASGSATLITCSACGMRGKMRCFSCAGSGWAS